MEKQLREAESTREPFALRQYLIILSNNRHEFSKELEARYLSLCRRLHETIRAAMPAT